MNGNFDWGFKFGDLLVVLGLLVTAGSFLFRRGGDLQKLEMAVDRALSEITGLKQEMSKMGEILTQVAVQNERMENMGKRMNIIDRRYDELRRGQGWIQERTSVDGEYP